MAIQKELKKYKGTILQKPPKASAVKINGKRAYNLFRNNENFEIKEKEVNIFEAKFINQIQQNISKIKMCLCSSEK